MNNGVTKKRIGVLIIHGMGEQNAYDTLDLFARGLYRHFVKTRGAAYDLKAEWKERGSDPSHAQKEWTQAQIRFEPNAAGAGLPQLTVTEYYWSPVTKGKLKDIAVLTWLIRTGLEPYRYLSENLQAMTEAARRAGVGGQSARLPHKAKQSAFILLREFLRLALFYIPLLGSFLALAAFLSYLPDLPKLLASLVQLHYQGRLLGLFLVLRIIILVSLSGYFANFGKWWRLRLAKSSSGRRFSAISLALAIIFAVALLLSPLGLLHWFQYCPPCGTYPSVWGGGGWKGFLGFLARATLVVPPFTDFFRPLAELGIALWIRNFLINFLGDVAIYTNLNQRQTNFAVRSQILEECGHAITSLYNDLQNEGDDFEIVVAAHSLGTVIAYDTLNDLFNRARIGAPAPGAQATMPQAREVCLKLRGLLTFGSPLNKTYYFFRDQSAAEAILRAQIIDQLHSFRLLAPTGALDGVRVATFDFGDAELRGRLQTFRWINIWSLMDPVSGKLFFYDVPERDQHSRCYWVPLLAHLSYWHDAQMYGWFEREFLS